MNRLTGEYLKSGDLMIVNSAILNFWNQLFLVVGRVKHGHYFLADEGTLNYLKQTIIYCLIITSSKKLILLIRQ